MILNKIDDPRDALSRARRMELFRFAQAQGISDIVQEMPASLMRRMLRARGLTNIRIPPRMLGAQNASGSSQQAGPDHKVNEIDADDDLARQFQEQQKAKQAAPAAGKMSMNELRAECKARGIKMDRRDNMETLRAKLNG